MPNPLLSITFDDAPIRRALAEVKRQIPQAIVSTLNGLAFAAQKEVRATLDTNALTIAPSKLKFMQSLVRVKKATKADLASAMGTTVGERGTTSRDRSFLLGRHEFGGTVTANDPNRPFFIPTKELRPGDRDLPPRALYPTNLRLFERRGPNGNLPIKSRMTQSGKIQIQGKRNTFVIDARTGGTNPLAYGVYQRIGAGRGQIKMLWMFRNKITLKPRLGFYQRAQHIADTRLGPIMDDAIAHTIETAWKR